jgi:hypothetical protein
VTPAGPQSGGALEPPLFAGAIHGIRSWNVTDHGLLRGVGVGREMVWSPDGEPTVAHCLQANHRAPDPDCGCGLYALHPYAYRRGRYFRRRGGPTITGIVEAWGRLEVHGRGFRAERARPVALLAPALHLAETFELERLEEVSERYGLPVIEVPLPEHAREWCRVKELGLERSAVGRLIMEQTDFGWVEELGGRRYA